jgi:hypothetical protein
MEANEAFAFSGQQFWLPLSKQQTPALSTAKNEARKSRRAPRDREFPHQRQGPSGVAKRLDCAQFIAAFNRPPALRWQKNGR